MACFLISTIPDEQTRLESIEQAVSEAREAARIYDEIQPNGSYLTDRKQFHIVPDRSFGIEPARGALFHELKADFGSESELCLVSSSHVRQVASGKKAFNLMDSLEDLVPRVGKQVGLVTFQNGIMNTPDDFKRMGEQVLHNFPSNPLCIGLYNRKLDLLNHLKRIPHHLNDKMTKVVGRTYVFFRKLIKRLHAINPQAIWIHVMHSEGGAIAHQALKALSKKEGDLIKQHLITVGCGPLMPIPDTSVLRAYNIYSSKDNTTGWFGKLYQEKKGYSVRFVDVDESLWQKVLLMAATGAPGLLAANAPPGDHDFRGDTYKNALQESIEDILDRLSRMGQ